MILAHLCVCAGCLHRERELARQLHEQQREAQRHAFMEQQRRLAEASRIMGGGGGGERVCVGGGSPVVGIRQSNTSCGGDQAEQYLLWWGSGRAIPPVCMTGLTPAPCLSHISMLLPLLSLPTPTSASHAFAEDEELPDAAIDPPPPLPLVAGLIAPVLEPIILEAWQLVQRFSPQLGLAQVPSLTQLEAALAGGPMGAAAQGKSREGKEGSGDAAVAVQIALLDFLITDLFENTAQTVAGKGVGLRAFRGKGQLPDLKPPSAQQRTTATCPVMARLPTRAHVHARPVSTAGSNSDVREGDLKPHTRARHPFHLKPDTFPEAARRYCMILALSAAAAGREGGSNGERLLLRREGGRGSTQAGRAWCFPAVHAPCQPGYITSCPTYIGCSPGAGLTYPLAILDPNLVLQLFTAGAPVHLEEGAAALPRNACKTAAHSITARCGQGTMPPPPLPTWLQLLVGPFHPGGKPSLPADCDPPSLLLQVRCPGARDSRTLPPCAYWRCTWDR